MSDTIAQDHIEDEVAEAPGATVRECDLCHETHEVLSATYMGKQWSSCPNLPENTIVPMERGESGRMQIAGLRRQSSPESTSPGAGPLSTRNIAAINPKLIDNG